MRMGKGENKRRQQERRASGVQRERQDWRRGATDKIGERVNKGG